nr:hypothetical protein [Candidatus Njordarchaeota archaeon]
MSLALTLFLLGLFPSYVSIFIVEKYYTAFWTGFWNIYGLLITSVGLALDNYNAWTVLVLFIVIVIVVILVYILIFAPSEAYLIRRFGASWVATSLNWGLYVGLTVDPFWGVFIIPIHAILMWLLIGLLQWLVRE